jgi:nitrogen-specific signal transduction histidine kinase/CheY-like chemotaxis protein
LAIAWSLLLLLGTSIVTGLRRIGEVERERVHLARRLDEAERLESLGRLAGGVAHDFNNVLTAIIGYASVLEHRLADRPKDQDLARRSGQAARRASETVRQLMAFARRSGLQVRPLSLHELVREVAGLLEHTLPRGIHVVLDFQAERDVLVGDASHLHQALLNLAVNARDAMPEGGTLRFSTRDPETSGDGLELRVSDTGAGIPPDVLPHVFEPFFTTKSGGRGTGLGLASVWGTVQRHGGSISVRSALGKGTEFVLNFPPAPPGTESEAPSQDASVRVSGRKLRIAALDDDVHVLDVISTMAHSLGHQADVHGNYRSLQDRLAAGTLPDLLILDLDMPDISGLEVLRRVQKEHPGLPVMIASGHSSSATLEEVRALGVRVFLKKPFGAADLDRAMEETLREPTA